MKVAVTKAVKYPRCKPSSPSGDYDSLYKCNITSKYTIDSLSDQKEVLSLYKCFYMIVTGNENV